MGARFECFPDEDEALTAFVANRDDVTFFTRRGSDGRVFLALAECRLHLRAEYEADFALVLDLYRQAVACGALQARVDSLLDLSAFIGTFDWDAVARMAALLPWGECGQNRSAYVFRDAKDGLLLKVLGVMFPGVEHRVFATPTAARNWLGW